MLYIYVSLLNLCPALYLTKSYIQQAYLKPFKFFSKVKDFLKWLMFRIWSISECPNISDELNTQVEHKEMTKLFDEINAYYLLTCLKFTYI